MGHLQEFLAQEHDYAFVFNGPMRCGKTSTTLAELLALEEHSLWEGKILGIRPENDTRDSCESASEKGFDMLDTWRWLDPQNPKYLFTLLTTVFPVLPNRQYGGKYIIAFDEGNFFSRGLADVVHKLSEMQIKTIICGLDKDYRGLPFGAMEPIMAMVPQRWQVQMSSCCKPDMGGSRCKNPGRYTQRYTKEDGIFVPSSFFEPTIVPENKAKGMFDYSVVCKEHHMVRHFPRDAFANRAYYETVFAELGELFVSDYLAFRVRQMEEITKARERKLVFD